MAWQNRIVGHRDVPPAELTAHPLNWRLHPKQQASGLRSVLEQVGLVQAVIVSKRSGRILDGHLRVETAITDEQPTIPITEVDLTEDEERVVLATFDPLSSMAVTDREQLDELLSLIPDQQHDPLQDLIDSMASDVSFWGIGDGTKEKRTDVALSLRVVCSSVEAIEQAIELAMSRGAGTRGEALAVICGAYGAQAPR